MRDQVERQELLLLGIPVGADSFENGGPVVEGMGHDVDVRIAQRHELAPEERPQLACGRRLSCATGVLLLQHECLLISARTAFVAGSSRRGQVYARPLP